MSRCSSLQIRLAMAALLAGMLALWGAPPHLVTPRLPRPHRRRERDLRLRRARSRCEPLNRRLAQVKIQQDRARGGCRAGELEARAETAATDARDDCRRAGPGASSLAAAAQRVAARAGRRRRGRVAGHVAAATAPAPRGRCGAGPRASMRSPAHSPGQPHTSSRSPTTPAVSWSPAQDEQQPSLCRAPPSDGT